MFHLSINFMKHCQQKLLCSSCLILFQKYRNDTILNMKIHDNLVQNKSSQSVRNFESLHLLKIGFSEESLEKLKKHLSVFELSTNKSLEATVDFLMKCQFGERNLVQLVEKHPYILLVNSEVIESHYIFLLSKFKKVSVFRIFLNSPEIFDDSLQTLKKKVNYFKNEMGVSDVEISKSGALAYSLNFIKERHIFLVRCGIYKIDDKDRTLDLKNKNPSLDHILNTKSKEFSRKVAGLPLFEFETFQQMFSEEAENGIDDVD